MKSPPPGDESLKGGGRELTLTLASVAVGILMAVLYHLASSRSQPWLTSHASSAAALLSVGAFLGRITIAGLVLLAIHFLTPLDVLAVAVAFVALFTVLSGYSLYRFAKKGNGSGISSQVLP
ncbi:MAG: hypothetical protein ACYC33_04710 [Thermoleophilia bacterium]